MRDFQGLRMCWLIAYDVAGKSAIPRGPMTRSVLMSWRSLSRHRRLRRVHVRKTQMIGTSLALTRCGRSYDACRLDPGPFASLSAPHRFRKHSARPAAGQLRRADRPRRRRQVDAAGHHRRRASRSSPAEVQVLGGDMAEPRHRAAICPRIAYMPQGLGRNLYPDLSVRENVDFFGRLFGQCRSRAAAAHRRAARRHRTRALRRPARRRSSRAGCGRSSASAARWSTTPTC